eukprot:m.356616 g.356616  ORF g.356616 m.356616 type:complete len:61 (-) comp17589_c0_seq1:3043-3225(-)
MRLTVHCKVNRQQTNVFMLNEARQSFCQRTANVSVSSARGFTSLSQSCDVQMNKTKLLDR